MGRPLRIDQPDMFHHVMNRGGRHGLIFLDDEDRQMFLALLAVITQRYGVQVHSYALMGNHFHLLLYCPDGNLSRSMQYLCSVYVRRFNRRHGFDGPLFRGRFESVFVADDPQLMLCARYIHRNPLDMDRLMDLTGFEWSSYGSIVGARHRPWWLVQDKILGAFDGDTEKLRDFTESIFPADKTRLDPQVQTAKARDRHCLAGSGLSAFEPPCPPPTAERVAAAVRGSILDDANKRGPTRQRLAHVRIGHRAGLAPAAQAQYLGVSTSTIWMDIKRGIDLVAACSDFARASKEAEFWAWNDVEAEPP